MMFIYHVHFGWVSLAVNSRHEAPKPDVGNKSASSQQQLQRNVRLPLEASSQITVTKRRV